AVELDYDIAFAQAGVRSRAGGRHRNDQHAAGSAQLVMAHQPAVQRHVLAADPDVAAPDFAFFNQPARNEFRRVDADGEADPLGGKNHGGIDADDLTSGVDQRAAGVAGVQRGVGLDDVINQPARVG